MAGFRKKGQDLRPRSFYPPRAYVVMQPFEHLPSHPELARLQNCLDALANDKSAKAQSRLVPALNMYVNGEHVEISPSGTHYQIVREVTTRRHLPLQAHRVAVEYAPFVPVKDEPRRRPTYVLEMQALPKARFESKEQIMEAFGPLLETHGLEPKHIAERHWNFGNKTKGNLFSVSRERDGQRVVLTAHTQESLIELANYYFHYAVSGRQGRTLAAKAYRGPQITVRLDEGQKRGQTVFNFYEKAA